MEPVAFDERRTCVARPGRVRRRERDGRRQFRPRTTVRHRRDDIANKIIGIGAHARIQARIGPRRATAMSHRGRVGVREGQGVVLRIGRPGLGRHRDGERRGHDNEFGRGMCADLSCIGERTFRDRTTFEWTCCSRSGGKGR